MIPNPSKEDLSALPEIIKVWEKYLGNYVEWIHVCELYRRQGIATEVLKALQEHLGQLSFDGATESGIGFCEAYQKGEEAGNG